MVWQFARRMDGVFNLCSRQGIDEASMLSTVKTNTYNTLHDGSLGKQVIPSTNL
jgi:hypothetical protein